MGRKSIEQKERDKHEAHLVRRRARRQAKKAEALLAVATEAPEVDPVVLGGERKSTPKRAIEARYNLTEAFDLMGGVPALVLWGKKNPTEFYRIWARLIPKEVAEETTRLPLEDLLGKLADRAEMSVSEAAQEIGEEILDRAAKEVSLEDAVAAYKGTLQ